MNFLVIAPSWIGDAVLTQPLLARLKAEEPEARIDVFAPKWAAPVYERMPEVSALIDNPFLHGELALIQRFRLGQRLVAKRYQRAYVLPNSLKSALVPFFAGIPERIGFVGESRYGLINRRHTLDKQRLPKMIDRYTLLAEAPGTPEPQRVPPLYLHSSPALQQAVLIELGLAQGGGTDKPPVVFCPGAEFGPAKRWPAAHFASLARVMIERGYPVWLLGSTRDKPIADEIVANSPGACRNLCGKTDLSQAIDLLAQAALVVSNDSGLMHIAAALDRPLVALYGSSSPIFTPPCSAQASIVRIDIECSPCFERRCPYEHLDCLQKLEPSKVLDACLRKLPN